MNTLLLDTLTDVELRDTATLEQAATEQASAGIPWLNEE
jgi:hypothetical protein